MWGSRPRLPKNRRRGRLRHTAGRMPALREAKEVSVAVLGRIVLTVLGVVLILLVLIQRGRGQGLAGAFGGTGGTSLLGTKAGSFIGKVTAWLAAIWMVLAIVLNIAFNASRPQ